MLQNGIGRTLSQAVDLEQSRCLISPLKKSRRRAVVATIPNDGEPLAQPPDVGFNVSSLSSESPGGVSREGAPAAADGGPGSEGL